MYFSIEIWLISKHPTRAQLLLLTYQNSNSDPTASAVSPFPSLSDLFFSPSLIYQSLLAFPITFSFHNYKRCFITYRLILAPSQRAQVHQDYNSPE